MNIEQQLVDAIHRLTVKPLPQLVVINLLNLRNGLWFPESRGETKSSMIEKAYYHIALAEFLSD